MDPLLKEFERLEKKANLGKVVDDIQVLIDQLGKTRAAILQDPGMAGELFDGQHRAALTQFDRVTLDLKDIYSGLSRYGKGLDRKFKERPLPFSEQDVLTTQTHLVNRAIAMHLLREGHFDVASTFMTEADATTAPLLPMADAELADADDMDSPVGGAGADDHMAFVDRLSLSHREQRRRLQQQAQQHHHRQHQQHRQYHAVAAPQSVRQQHPHQHHATEPGPLSHPDALHEQFQEMYSILNHLRNDHDLGPAIAWARANLAPLEARGSNLLYDLCQLQYILLFQAGNPGPAAALQYARETFRQCPPRYAPEVQRLVGALAFLPNLPHSPYADLFGKTLDEMTGAAASAFTADFCALLSLSSASPLLTAVTAGCIALPTLLKLSQIQQSHRTSWTTASELPVEVPLPPAYHFHNIFVCPVSKEQSTDANPPMMMPCRHVICKESLERVSRGSRFKCPYCPAESHKNEAKRVFV